MHELEFAARCGGGCGTGCTGRCGEGAGSGSVRSASGRRLGSHGSKPGAWVVPGSVNLSERSPTSLQYRGYFYTPKPRQNEATASLAASPSRLACPDTKP